MLHYVRDLNIAATGLYAGYNGNMGSVAAILYWLLRAMGWSRLWECDGRYDAPNRCPDGDMELSGIANWTAQGTAVVTKSTSNKHQGTQGLSIASSALNDGVRATAFTNLDGSQARTYTITLWASNNTGSSWDVQVDAGGGYASVGNIPHNGGTWSQYDFQFTTSGGFSLGQMQILDNNTTTGTIYIDDVYCYYSWFEFNYDQRGQDGDVQNGDEFSSSGYSFVAGDIGKIIVFYDPNNLGNTGAYDINAISGTNAVLDLRMGGSETLINTAVGNLMWVMLDPTSLPSMDSASTPSWISGSSGSAGFGMESPYSSSWRFFLRLHMRYGSNARGIVTWSAPVASEFSVMDGVFFPDQASVFRDRVEPYVAASLSNFRCFVSTGTIGQNGVTHTRMYAVVSSGGEFLAVVARRVPDGSDACFAVGVMNTSDPEGHTTRETFCHFARASDNTDAEYDELSFDTGEDNFSYAGNCGAENNSMPRAAAGIMCGTTANPITDADARANPISGEEWRMRLAGLRDADMIYGDYSEFEITIEDAFWGCRRNLQEWDTFDPVDGTNSAFSLSGSTITFTSSEALFTPSMVGREITIAGATTPGNDGTFVITSYISTTQVTYENAGGATEAGAGTWAAFEQYFHFDEGFCWKWPGFTALS